MSKKRELKLSLLAIMVMAFSAVGCQSNPVTTAVRYDNVRFMDLWNTYTHCLSSEQAHAAMLDSTKLYEVSLAQSQRSSLKTFLPPQLNNMVAQPSSRLAVDVHAMAASCSLHTGDLALSVGEHDLARDQFRQILNGHAQSDSSYYAVQAQARLAALELTLQASLQ
ncbi:MAG: hypothetical protein CV089_07120 [Nitrospira sp. WS110]|nr:hypothetical protein [Nitrospira sp. WS110]